VADFLIYGATGYTGSLIADEAVRRGFRPILGGGTLGPWRRWPRSWDWSSVSSPWMNPPQ
jgi:hypothetical protein